MSFYHLLLQSISSLITSGKLFYIFLQVRLELLICSHHLVKIPAMMKATTFQCVCALMCVTFIDPQWGTIRFEGIIFACMFSCFNYLHWGYSIIANWSNLLMCANVYNSRVLKIQILTLCLPPNSVCRSCYRWCLLNEHPHCKHTAHSTAQLQVHIHVNQRWYKNLYLKFSDC